MLPDECLAKISPFTDNTNDHLIVPAGRAIGQAFPASVESLERVN